VKSRIIDAFEVVRDNYSADRVVADPTLNAAFVAKCREIGVGAEPATLNRSLINLRKTGHLRHLKSRRTSFPNEDPYRFAAEMAARFMERRDGVTLDDIICDPELAAEFDRLAAAISPGFTPLEYRWAALNLRKASRLAPELLARVAPPLRVLTLPVSAIDLATIETVPGLYLFYTPTVCLYVGEAESLRNRIGKHLDHSDNKGLARWMWEQGIDQLFLELQVLDSSISQKVRRALERELIRSRNPHFNIQR
jgi:site-specific DNA-methyltransferase (adenine-specific)